MSAPARTDVEAIWAEVGTALEAFVRRHIADPHHAEDVVAEVLLRVHEHIGHVDEHERVTAWVWRITRNTITDHYRRTGRRRETSGVDEVPGVDGADGWIDDQATVLQELATCIRPLLDGLPEEHRRALELTDMDGRTQAEAARIEGVTLSAMKSRVQRGRRLVAALVLDCCEVSTDRRGEPVEFHPRPGGCACSPSSAPPEAPPPN